MGPLKVDGTAPQSRARREGRVRAATLAGQLGIAATLAAATPAAGQPPTGPYSPWGMHYMWGAWGFGMMVLTAIIWVLIIVGAVVAIRWLFAQSAKGGGDGPGLGEAPMDILKRRYARGEIAKQEFEEMRRDLEA